MSKTEQTRGRSRQIVQYVCVYQQGLLEMTWRPPASSVDRASPKTLKEAPGALFGDVQFGADSSNGSLFVDDKASRGLLDERIA